MDRRLIVLDLDGTLLKDDKTISKRSLHAIFEAQKAGHIVSIATGRPYRASKMYYQQLGLHTPMVNFNGAYVHHPLDTSFQTRHTPLDLNVARTIIDTCEAFQVQNIIAEVADDVYLHDYDEELIELFSLGGYPTGYGHLKYTLHENPTSLLIYPSNNVEGLKDLLSDKHATGVHQRSWGEPFHVIEMIRTGNNKAAGLQSVLDYCQLSMKSVIAFGDEDNDLEMLDEAGVGVAMGNGINEVKQTANEVTFSNEEDGIARFLEDYLNLPTYDEDRNDTVI